MHSLQSKEEPELKGTRGETPAPLLSTTPWGRGGGGAEFVRPCPIEPRPHRPILESKLRLPSKAPGWVPGQQRVGFLVDFILIPDYHSYHLLAPPVKDPK